jgi:hypothetical protein
MSRVEPKNSSEPKRYGDARRSRDERVAKKPSQAEWTKRSGTRSSASLRSTDGWRVALLP